MSQLGVFFVVAALFGALALENDLVWVGSFLIWAAIVSVVVALVGEFSE